ncbi:4Fe-4S binding protein [Thalassospiraceae bacterium LMO-JJ14]|nr:4Fe-4S binding protein [Thalassospiraceae bacterium LMO-JJ14]
MANADNLADVFPNADKISAFTGQPPAATAFINDKAAGYILSTADVIGSTGYGGEIIDVRVGVSTDGNITGAILRRHNEPILVIGISDQDLQRFVSGLKGFNVLAPALTGIAGGNTMPDAIAGATISSAVIQDAVVRAARSVLRARAPAASGSILKREPYTKASWQSLLADDSVQHLELDFTDIAKKVPDQTGRQGLFIDLYAALLTPPRIGGNLLGTRDHQQLFSSLGAGDNAILIAANGVYSFKGRQYRKTGTFDRIQIVQGVRTLQLHRDAYTNIEALKAAGAPELREIALFVLPADTGFDPLQPWRLELFINPDKAMPNGEMPPFALEYTLPDRYVMPAPASAAMEPADRDAKPLWQRTWEQRRFRIAGVLALLAVLTGVLVFQDQLVRYRRFRDTGRLAFLAVVLVWLGWYAGGQLSVLQVLTFAHALLGEFRWEHFLVDPMIFVLWGYVAVTLLFWGRGVYCGWLCPFGALQELMNAAARRMGVPQLKIPFAVHERLWAIKYIIFLGLFAASLHTIREATLLAEVEPFKTAITMTFVRSWPFVVYVAALLAAGLFIERFFCRYLCPLGAALAIPARLRMFNWLRRRHQCGSECQICSERCTVQAIHPTGEINPNECIYCLECQTYYVDDHICPPLVASRKKRERRQALTAGQDISAERPDHG